MLVSTVLLKMNLFDIHGFILGKTDQCRGFGYVIFALPEDAEKAASAVKTFRGRRLGVCFANKKPKQEKRKFKPGGNVSHEDDNHTEDNPSKQIFSSSTECRRHHYDKTRTLISAGNLLLVHLVIYVHVYDVLKVLKIRLVQFENFQNNMSDHKSQNARAIA